jgi:putative phosphoesterase
VLIGVMSDTHDNVRASVASVKVFQREGVEMIIHLGDIVSPFTLSAILSAVEPGVDTLFIYGNNCGEKTGLREVAVSRGARIVDPPVEVDVDGKHLLLLHGWGPEALTLKVVEALALGGDWDGILYGHTHKADYRYIRGVLILNPGEASGVLTGKATIAILDTDTLKARILEVPRA